MPKKPKKRVQRIGHLAHIRQHIPHHDQDDEMTLTWNFDKNYSIKLEEGPESLDDIAAYTDGSKIADESGSGVFIKDMIYFAEKLPDHATVYQCEHRAIQMASEYLMDYRNRKIFFHVDSLSALQSLQATRITSRTVYDTVLLLQSLAKHNTVTLQKIRAHDPKAAPDSGNEMADKAAKWGTFFPDHMIKTHIHKSRTIIKNHIKNRMRTMWQSHWKTSNAHYVAKPFLSGPPVAMTRRLEDLDMSLC